MFAYRKIVNCLFGLSLVFFTAFPSLAMGFFPDVYPNNPYHKAIEYVEQNKIVSGYPNGTFKPENLINRAEFVKILIEAKFNDEEIKQCLTTPFKDVKSSEWYTNYLCIAQKEKLVDGYPDGTFKPANNISFVEAAKILRNTFLPNDELVTISFKNWYEPYVNVLSAHRAIPVSIYGFDTFITREQMAEMIYRLDAKIEVLPSLSIWEMGDRAIIDDYYSKIASAKLEEAYNLKVEPEMNLDQFKELYKDFPINGRENFSKIGAHTFEFSVVTYPHIFARDEKKDEQSERYKVSMQVVDGKLKTLSSEKQTNALLEEITNGKISASLDWEGGVYKIYVYENGQKTLVSEHDTKNGITLTIKNVMFSPGGKYLTYQIRDWEFAGVSLYEIESKAELATPLFGISFYGFSDDDKFYFCSESGMSSGEIAVLTLPGLDNFKRIDTGKDIIHSCGPFDALNDILHYQLQSPDGSVLKKMEFKL